jgi:hypothetical protein
MSCKEGNLKLMLKSEIIAVKWIRWCYYNAVPRAGFACRLWIYLEIEVIDIPIDDMKVEASNCRL